MKTSIVRICFTVAINIKGRRPLSASPSSDHFVSFNWCFYESFKLGFIVRHYLQREVTLCAEMGGAQPWEAPLRSPTYALMCPTYKEWDGRIDAAGGASMGCCMLMDIADKLPLCRRVVNATYRAGIQ